MTKGKLLKLYTTLQQLSNVRNTKFAYFVMKNLKKIEPEVDIIKELRVPPKEFSEYEKDRIALCRKHAELTEDNQPKIKPNGSYEIRNKDKFDKEIKKLKGRHKNAIEAKENKDKELIDFLKEDVEIDFYKIKFENLPELNARQLIILDELIIEE